ncbi:MAG TPA: hypothetical protein VMU15_11055 [Anaeromyxobacter sp.]|nr:hypothetical protein [Anaeromyxobacter sp.]
MRRALLVLLALPAPALAQTINLPTGVSTINIAQCTGTNTGQVPPLSDTMSMDLTWTVAAINSSTIATGDQFLLYATTTQPAAGQTINGTLQGSCTQNSSLGTISVSPIDTLSATSTTLTSPENITMAAIAAGAGISCTSGTSTTVYLCVQWVSSGNAVKGYATTSMAVDLTQPTAPTLSAASPGDGALHLSCSASGSGTTFKGQAISETDSTEVHYSGQASSCSNVVISGLTNDQPYYVVVFGIDTNNNPSAASDQVTGTPVQTSDFWQQYQNDGGRERGGCSSAAGAAGILGALSLLALRRRKP